jgi:CHASE2 domain-containing sensor protein
MSEAASAKTSKMLSLLAGLAAVAPFAFGIIRAITTGTDFRYIWVALASGLGAAAANRLRTPRAPGVSNALELAAAVFVVATLGAAVAAWLLGTTPNLGMLVVVSAFGVCFGAAACLLAFSRRNAA